MAQSNEDFGIPPTAQEFAEMKAKLATAEAALATATVPDDGAHGTPAREGTGPADAQGFPKKYVRLTIYPSRNPQDPPFWKGGVNGYVWRITCGQEVVVPSVVASECLDHAVENITVQSEGGLITRPQHRFPYQVNGPATEEEYLAFQSRMRTEGATAALQRA